jgi:hypothetical protein
MQNWEIFFFLKNLKIQNLPSPLSQAILAFWPRGGGALQHACMEQEGGLLTTSATLHWTTNQHHSTVFRH